MHESVHEVLAAVRRRQQASFAFRLMVYGLLAGALGGLVIGGIYNGMYLLQMSIQWQYVVTGLVLLAAVTIDSLSRRGSISGAMGFRF